MINIEDQEKSSLTELWTNELSEWKSTGLSAIEYCRRKGLGKNKFFYWKRKLSTKCEPEGFIEISKFRQIPHPVPVLVKKGQ